MEREIEGKFDEIMGVPAVVGVVCADKQGLCVSVRGIGTAEQAGVIRNIADQARKLEPNSTTPPLIRLESEQGYCLVKKTADFTLGIFKANQ